MTKSQFIASVEAKSIFKSWAKAPEIKEKIGDIEKWNGVAYISTPNGVNLFDVWFIWDSVKDEAYWQNQDTLEPEKNTESVKLKALETYLKNNFNAYFLGRVDIVNNWAEADVYTLTTGKLVKKAVIVYKQGTNPISHLDVI